MAEKEELERWAVLEFAKLFTAKANRGALQFVELLKPPSPDALCHLDKSDLFVEVAHVYGTETDAKMALGREGKSAPDPRVHNANAMISFDQRVIGPLNILLKKKAGKTYDKSPVWLLVRSGFLLMDFDDFSLYQDSIAVPKNHPFEEIWLLCGKTSDSGAIQLASKNAAERPHK
ncbi:MAG: hypothetical protein KOO63_03655 [Bacteroidales bacterium]|nr:hypothetical protein [Candidatus Latescibacterota bacterium]